MTALSRTDAVQLLSFLGDAHTVQGPEPFTTELLDRLAEVMRCEFATYQRLDVSRRVVSEEIICSNEARNPAAPEPGSHDLRESRVVLSLSSGEVTKWSDEFDRSTRRRFEPFPSARLFEVVDCVAICIGSGLDRSLLIFHSRERDFTEADRRRLHALDPHAHALIRWARARKRLAGLTSAIDAQDEFEARGFLLFDGRLEIEQGSPAALRILRTWFGETDGRLPGPIGEWLLSRSACEPFRIAGDGKRLVVEAPTDGALVVTEEELLPASLTAREIEVLSCIAAGRTTGEIARLLWVTPATVSKHLEHIYRKLGVSSRTAALAAAGLKAESLSQRDE